MSFLDNLEWRFATKEFDTDKPISRESLDKVLSAVRYVPSSYGLQPYHIYVIEDLKTRKKIKKNAFLQKQFDTCSYLLIFCAITDKKQLEKRVDAYANLFNDDKKLKLKIQATNLVRKGSIQNKTNEELANWAAKQCYIALGFGLAACAELKIDSCPMEGFSKEAIDKILDLPESMKSTVMLTIGNRKEEPKYAKVRFSEDDLFTFI